MSVGLSLNNFSPDCAVCQATGPAPAHPFYAAHLGSIMSTGHVLWRFQTDDTSLHLALVRRVTERDSILGRAHIDGEWEDWRRREMLMR